LEIRINKEIRDYTESIFFGLSLRQFLCAIYKNMRRHGGSATF
jgi:hypothetical protein